jgi:hypothetical protein
MRLVGAVGVVGGVGGGGVGAVGGVGGGGGGVGGGGVGGVGGVGVGGGGGGGGGGMGGGGVGGVGGGGVGGVGGGGGGGVGGVGVGGGGGGGGGGMGGGGVGGVGGGGVGLHSNVQEDARTAEGRMSWTSAIVSAEARHHYPPRMLVYGPEGIGKSSFSAELPRPITIDYDHGVDEVAIDRLRGPDTWEESLALIHAIAETPSGYESLVIDTIDPLERKAVDSVLRLNKKKDLSEFTWGAGYSAVTTQWKLLLAELDLARANGMTVLLLGHSQIRQAHDPQLGEFDAVGSALGKSAWNITKQWADLVGFANFDAALHQGEKSSRIIVTGQRMLFTTRGSGFEAKNRYSIDRPIPLVKGQSWKTIEAEIARHRAGNRPVTADEVRDRIALLAAGTEYEAKAAEYVRSDGEDVTALLETEKALKLKLKLNGTEKK